MDEKHMEMMRSLTAAQAALWDVIDDGGRPTSKKILAIVVAHVTRLSYEITGLKHEAK